MKIFIAVLLLTVSCGKKEEVIKDKSTKKVVYKKRVDDKITVLYYSMKPKTVNKNIDSDKQNPPMFGDSSVKYHKLDHKEVEKKYGMGCSLPSFAKIYYYQYIFEKSKKKLKEFQALGVPDYELELMRKILGKGNSIAHKKLLPGMVIEYYRQIRDSNQRSILPSWKIMVKKSKKTGKWSGLSGVVINKNAGMRFYTTPWYLPIHNKGENIRRIWWPDTIDRKYKKALTLKYYKSHGIHSIQMLIKWDIIIVGISDKNDLYRFKKIFKSVNATALYYWSDNLAHKKSTADNPSLLYMAAIYNSPITPTAAIKNMNKIRTNSLVKYIQPHICNTHLTQIP
jgi:hypothetical protein